MTDRPSKRRLALVLVAGLVTLWFSTSITASIVLADYHPERAMTAWPTDAARGSRSWSLLTTGDPQNADTAQADGLSRALLKSEAISVNALRNLAVSQAIRGRSSDQLRPLFTAAERLSRRDVPTQLWFIEDNVARGDVAGALRHYDVLMRTSRTAQLTMIPQLVVAAGDRPVADELGKILSKRPHWWSAFFDEMLSGSSSADSIGLLASRLRLNAAVPSENEQLARTLTKLVELKSYPTAFALYRQARPVAGGRTTWPLNGDFSVEKPLPPFEWAIVADPELGALVEPRTGSQGPALTLVASNGRNGAVAQQLMVLRPGGYALRATVGGVAAGSSGQSALRVVCAETGAVLTEKALTDTKGQAEIADFTVGTDACSAQWLIVIARAGETDPQEYPWVDSVTVAAQAGR